MQDPSRNASSQRLRAVVESSPIGLLMVDARGLIVLVNAEVERLFGHARETMYGRPVEFLLPERYRGRHPVFREQFGRDPAARKMGAGRELRGLRADGTEFPVEIGLTPVVTDEGLFVIGSVVDIAPRLEAEGERRHLEEQLRQSQKMEALGTLAGGVAHDFNNVLAVIVGLGELIQREVGDRPGISADIRELLEAAGRGRELVDRILRFSRRQAIDMRTVDLADTIAQSTRLLRSSLPPSIAIETQLSAKQRTVRGDVTSLQQVLMNLATNAAHAMPNGGTLQVLLEDFYVRDSVARARPELREGLYLRLSVRDSGMGMDEVTRLKAFEPFFSTKPPGEGSGLGLALVHGIVRDHQGSVELESLPGIGTTVHCLLPVQADAAAAVVAPVGTAAPGRGERVLYVDDEPSLISIGRRQLEALGYAVQTFGDPAGALAAIRAEPGRFQVVVTDYLMPRMNGLQFARALQETQPGLPVILLSGFIGDFTPEELRQGGVVRVLQKPVAYDGLATALRDSLAGESTP
jgi:PAS domain S-box-containing protein